MLAWATTKDKDRQNCQTMKKTLLNVTSTFCEGYGRGIVGKVIYSPYKELIGTSFKVDLRNSHHFNMYPTKVKR